MSAAPVGPARVAAQIQKLVAERREDFDPSWPQLRQLQWLAAQATPGAAHRTVTVAVWQGRARQARNALGRGRRGWG